MTLSHIRVTIWNEFLHEVQDEEVARIYPKGMHYVIGDYLKRQSGLKIDFATLEQPEHGLTTERLDTTDVLIWWGHRAHGRVEDTIVDRVHRRVLDGMGFVALHSAHESKIFQKLMGTTCALNWREAGEKERIWVVDPSHPIAQGLGEYIEIEEEEMYGEFFDIPPPEALVFVSWFQGGEVFRSGCCYTRGAGKIFYFRPGHETHPTYYHPDVLKVIENAVRWATPTLNRTVSFGNRKPLEAI